MVFPQETWLDNFTLQYYFFTQLVYLLFCFRYMLFWIRQGAMYMHCYCHIQFSEVREGGVFF